MFAGKIGAMVGVEDGWNAISMPARIFFPTDRLTKRQRGGQRSGLLKAEPIANNHAAVVIFYDGEVGLVRLACFIKQKDGKLTMIRLPHRIGVGCLSPIQE